MPLAIYDESEYYVYYQNIRVWGESFVIVKFSFSVNKNMHSVLWMSSVALPFLLTLHFKHNITSCVRGLKTSQQFIDSIVEI